MALGSPRIRPRLHCTRARPPFPGPVRSPEAPTLPTTMKHRSLAVLALTSIAAVAPPAAAAGEDDLRDSVLLENGKTLRGRVLERYGEEHVILYQGNKRKKLPVEDVVSLTTVRDKLRSFLAEHVEGLTVEEEWGLVQTALDLELPRMADLQAWRVLVFDPQHDGAHEHLGHVRRRGAWRWPIDRKQLKREDWEETIQDWNDRLVLESEHYLVETNTSLHQAVNCLFDLELVYLEWMDRFGEELRAGEEVLRDEDRMVVHVFRDRQDKGYKDYYNKKREPHYDPSTQVRTSKGFSNLAFVHYNMGRGSRPVGFFDVAIQQLMYSTLVLSRQSGYLPHDVTTRDGHWVELGFGYWFGRQFGGSPGYARHLEFTAEPKTARLANVRMTRGPLSSRPVRKEVKNLIGLELRHYYTIDKDNTSEIYRAKARNFFRFLIETDPPVIHRNKVVGSGRAGLVRYLREVYVKPTSHSSSSFDDSLGGKAELLYDPWVKWRMQ